MVKIPIACTLTVEDATDRIEEWRAFFASHVSELRLSTPTQMAVRLGGDEAALLAAADLAEREQTCCSFFAFSIDIGGGGRWLSVSVPDDAAPVLADFSVLAQEALASRTA